MAKVLITSANTRVAYSICCSLAQSGYEVYAGDRTKFTMTGVSRYCKGTMVYPSPFTEQEKFIDTISNFMQENEIDILIPVLEETFTCLKFKVFLERSGVSFLLPEYEKALKLHSKDSLTALANELNLDTPQSFELEEILRSSENIEKLPFPVIIKPKQGGGGWGMTRIYSCEEFKNQIENHDYLASNYIVQELVEGQLIGACAIYHKGKYIIADSYKSTTVYPLLVGQPTTRLSHDYPQALEAVKKMLDYLEWNGVCEIDFIVDENKNKSYLIDANPRFWGSIKQNIAAGVDYPLYYALLAKNCEDFLANDATIGTRTRWLGGDILRIISQVKEATNPLRELYSLFSSKINYDAYDDFSIKDPLPLMAWGINLTLNKILKRKKDALPDIWR